MSGIFARVAAACALLVLLVAGRARALEPPALTGRVNDYANLLPPEVERAISGRLAAHEQKSGHQFVVLTVPSLEGEVLEDFSLKTVEKWRLGRAKVDDGLLLLVAEREHKVRIEVGYGLEGQLTDAFTSRVIRNTLVPAFRKNDYAGGIDRGVSQLLGADGDPQAGVPAPLAGDRTPGAPGAPGLPFFPLLLFLPIVGLFLWLRLAGYGGRSWGGGYGGSSWGGGGWGGGGGSWGGGGGGGGFSGGGGSFGGGGASGSW